MATTKAAGQMIYLVENLSDARLRCDQLKRYLAKAMKLIEKSSKRDHFYEVAGDILNGVPEVIFKLDKALDATGLAASRLDYEELKQQLSPEKVDELEEVLEDVRVKHLERRSSPEKDSQVKKAAADLSSEILKIASGVEDASMSPTEAYSRIAGLQGRTAELNPSDVDSTLKTLEKELESISFEQVKFNDMQRKNRDSTLIRAELLVSSIMQESAGYLEKPARRELLGYVLRLRSIAQNYLHVLGGNNARTVKLLTNMQALAKKLGK